jgi:hypothetical protein
MIHQHLDDRHRELRALSAATVVAVAAADADSVAAAAAAYKCA